MIIEYNIIKENIVKFNEALKQYSLLREIVKSVENGTKINDIINKSTSSYQQIDDYIDFFEFLHHRKNFNEDIIYEKLSFEDVKERLINNSAQIEFTRIARTLTKRKLNNLIKNKRKFKLYNGHSNSPRSKTQWKRNLTASKSTIMNWVIQNQIQFEISSFGKWYYTRLPEPLKSASYRGDNTEQFLSKFEDFIKSYNGDDMVNASHDYILLKMTEIYSSEVRNRVKKTEVIHLNDKEQLPTLPDKKQHTVLDFSISNMCCRSCEHVKDIYINYQIDSNDGKYRLYSGDNFRTLKSYRKESLKKLLSEP
jgi:hypothetical protein